MVRWSFGSVKAVDEVMRDAVDRAGAVVIEVGLPVWRPEHARGYVATYGAGRASLAAASEILQPPVRA